MGGLLLVMAALESLDVFYGPLEAYSRDDADLTHSPPRRRRSCLPSFPESDTLLSSAL